METEDNAENIDYWENRTDTPEIKIWLKKNGSDVNKGQPYLKVEMVFADCYSMDQIINAVCLIFIHSLFRYLNLKIANNGINQP